MQSRKTLTTSLQSISDKARREKKHRFQNLCGMLTEQYLTECFNLLRKKASPGIDKITVKEYAEGLTGKIRDLVTRLKEKRYRAPCIKRVYIPKANGKMRPLGLPTTEDKVLQTGVNRILQAIFENDFLDSSYGYREKRGAKDAIIELTHKLQFGRYTYIVEADIKGFFDNIDHEWLIKMVKERIDDRVIIRLIEKWLKAGVLEPEGKTIHPASGTPQGGIISPTLANIYLHFVLDLWFEKIIKKECEGEAFIIRYADDFVCGFRFAKDAEKFYGSLIERMKKFGLSLAEDKTQIIKFNRHLITNAKKFQFLGFEFYWDIDAKGKPNLRRITSQKKLKGSLLAFKEWIKQSRNFRLRKIFDLLNAKLRGYYNYYGLIGNYDQLAKFYYHCLRMLYKWLNRRSQRRSFNYTTFKEILQFYQIEKPRITQLRREKTLFPEPSYAK